MVVEQTFKNPYDHKIEATYLFPLPTGAAVNDLEILESPNNGPAGNCQSSVCGGA